MTQVNTLFQLESLILAQNERWRRGLGMQVVRGSLTFRLRFKCQGCPSGKRVSNAWVINPQNANNSVKTELIRNETTT